MDLINWMNQHGGWLWLISIVVLPYVLAESALFLTVLSQSVRFWSKQSKEPKKELTAASENDGISVLVPAYNEEKVVVESVRSILASSHSSFEVIVINDGSMDNTLGVLEKAFDLRKTVLKPRDIVSESPVRTTYRSRTNPNLVVLDKLHPAQGKADALNTGIGYASYDLVCVVDADSILEKDSLLEILQPFKQQPETIAVGGAIRPVNAPKKIWPLQLFNPLAWAQTIEYARIFYMDRVVLSKLNLNYIISGAFGLFRREAMIAVGGYRKSLAEDMDLTLRLHRHYREEEKPYRISHAPKATCWTEVPYTLEIFERQRARWHSGFIQGVLEHRDIIGKKRFAGFGKIVLPYCLLTLGEPLFVLMSLVLTIFSFIMPAYTGGVIATFFIAHFVFSLTYLAALSFAEMQKPKFKLGHVLKNYVLWLVFGKIFDTISFLFRLSGYRKYFAKETSWGRMERRGELMAAYTRHSGSALERAEA